MAIHPSVCLILSFRRMAAAVQLSNLGWAGEGIPRARLLLKGPPGSGKTHLIQARFQCTLSRHHVPQALVQAVFGDERALVVFDCRELTERASLARLIGAPPGYVGHEEAGLLHATMSRRPASCVVFDHLPAAHPDVQQLVAQALQTGVVHDGRNACIRFDHAVVVVTADTADATGGDVAHSGGARAGASRAAAAAVGEQRRGGLSSAIVDHVDEVRDGVEWRSGKSLSTGDRATAAADA